MNRPAIHRLEHHRSRRELGYFALDLVHRYLIADLDGPLQLQGQSCGKVLQERTQRNGHDDGGNTKTGHQRKEIDSDDAKRPDKTEEDDQP